MKTRPHPAVAIGSIFLVALAVRLLALQLSFDESELFGKYWTLGRELRASHFVADRPFSYAPIYCYFIALGQTILGDSPHRVLWVQCVVGAANCVLIYGIASRLIGASWAWLPALVACVYRSFVLYDVTLLSDSIGLFFQLALLLVLGRAGRDAGWGRYALAGLGIGLSMLHRPNNLLLLPLVLAFGFARDPRAATWLRRGAALIGVATITILPVVVQNVRLTGSVGITASNPGYIFYSSNNAASFGFRYSPPELFYRGEEYYRRLQADRPEARFLGDAEIATILSGAVVGHPMSLAESSRYYTEFTLAHIRSYPRHYLSLGLRKLWLAVHGYESHDVAPVFARYDRIAPLSPVRFAFVAPLGLFGLALSVARSRECSPGLWAVVVNNLALLGLFYVVVRFRLPLEAILLVAAAAAARALWGWARQRRAARLVAAALVLALLGVGCNLLPRDMAERARYRERELRLERAGRLLARGSLEQAATMLEKLIEEDTEELPRAVTAHRMLASIYARSGAPAESSAMKAPDHFETPAVVRRLAEKLEREQITFAELRYLAFLYRSRGDRVREQQVLGELLRRRPPEPLGRFELAEAQLAAGQPDAAKAHLLRAVDDGLLFTTRGLHGAVDLALIFREEGNAAAYRSWLDQAVRLSALAPWYPDEPRTVEILERLADTPGTVPAPPLERLAPRWSRVP